MLTFMFHIVVKEGCQAEAVGTLSAIESAAHNDKGCINFIWLQNKGDPHRFTLFEQWASQEDLDEHLRKNPSRWERFVPCLAAKPYSESFQLVGTLVEPLKGEETRRFVETWFDKLSRHSAVEELLAMLADDSLEMVFPEETLRNKEEFIRWYGNIGRLYDNQVHMVEKLEAQSLPGLVDISLTVVWKAQRKLDNTHLASRAQQAWKVELSPTTMQPVITKYHVLSLEEIH